MFKVFRKRKKKVPVQPEAPKTKPDAPFAPNGTNGSAKKESAKVEPKLSPEELCDIKPGMAREEIREHLAMLFRRHNRAAASLDEKLRSEAEVMLDAIVAVREKYLAR